MSSNPFKTSMVKLFVPPHMGNSISARGFTLEPDEDRCVDVPGDVAEDLKGHGLVAVPTGQDATEFALSMMSAAKVEEQMRSARKK